MANYTRDFESGETFFNDTNYDNGSNVIALTNDQLNAFLNNLGVSKISYSGSNVANHNKTFHINGQRFTIENVQSGSGFGLNADTYRYNLYDAVAMAKAAGIYNTDIAKALNKAGIYDSYDNGDAREWTNDTIKTININTTPASQRLQKELDKRYPGLDAYVSVIANKAGDGYTTRIVYYNADGEKQVLNLGDIGKELSDTKVSELIGDNSDNGVKLNNAATYKQQSNTLITNAQADADLAQSVLDALKRGGFKNANTANDLSEEDWQSITAALPSTDDLKAWNGTKDTGVFNKLITTLKDTNPQLIKRMSYDQLKGLADAVSSEQQTVTERGIKNQQAQLLQNIAKDPALYDAIVKQQRADAASNIIAGQRAANAQEAVAETNAGYDEQAAKLYESLFGGEQNVAAKTYNDAMQGKKSALDVDIQQKLDDAMALENQRTSYIANLTTMLEALGKAAGVDVAKWADSIAENQAVAGGKASTLVSAIKDKLTTAQANNEANIKKVQDLFGEGAGYINQGNNNGVDVNEAIKKITEALETPVASSGYKTVTAPEYEKTEQFDNKQYADVTDPEFLNWILSDKTIDSATKAKTLDALMNQSGLDVLTLEGLTSYYDGFNKEATGEANKVFNQAQRAYIAAITAGDAKTAEQLTRLATNAGTAKGNLYAASALANQFKQQTGLNNNGRQLATDFLNQQSFNRVNKDQAQFDAAATQLKYLGNGSGNYNNTTLYDVYSKHLDNSAKGFNAYGQFGSTIMGHNQDMSSHAVNNNIQNHNRFVDVANQYTSINAGGAAVNTDAQGAIETLRAQADAKLAQANKILKK